jgi:catechol 2,3-dioxygenase-like lactoylglutathione lyase family enzyme
MILGLNHVGIGVTNLEKSLDFYRESMGFKRIVSDVAVWDRGICQVIGRSVKARIVYLENETGNGVVKLVQLLPLYDQEAGHMSRPLASDRRWGDPGHLEVALEVSDVDSTYNTFEKEGLDILLSPQHWHIPGTLDGTYFYVRDPDGTFVEIIGGAKKEAFAHGEGVYGLNHVAMGVRNMDRSLNFYCHVLGFTVLIDVCGTFPGQETVVGEKIELRIVMLGHPNGGARIELVQILPPNLPKPIPPERRWGDIGVMEAALKVLDIEEIYRKMSSLNVQFLSPVSTLPGTQVRYLFMADPDDNEIGLYQFQ